MSLTETPSHTVTKWISLDDIRKECPLLPDDAKESIVSRAILASILRANSIDEDNYQVYIIDHENSLEVKHTKNGAICIPLALYRKAKTHDARAFILSHELAHHINGDVKYTESLLSRDPACQEIQSREKKADLRGLDLYKKRGYDTHLALEFVRELWEESGWWGPESCHIEPKERLQLLRKNIKKRK